MRNLGRLNLCSLKQTKNWKSNFFPNEKLNYTFELLLWYYLFILLKKIKLKTGQKIIAFEIFQKNLDFIKLKIICHQFNSNLETHEYISPLWTSDAQRKTKKKLLEKFFSDKRKKKKKLLTKKSLLVARIKFAHADFKRVLKKIFLKKKIKKTF